MALNGDLHRQLTALAQQFQLFECIACAQTLRQFCQDHHIQGRYIILFTGSTEDPFCNIYHEQLQCNISINGYHAAIAVAISQEELVFDNIHPNGVPRIEWLKNFYSPMQDLGQDFKIIESEF